MRVRIVLVAVALAATITSCSVSAATAPAATDTPAEKAKATAPGITAGYSLSIIDARLHDSCTLMASGYRIPDFVALLRPDEDAHEMGRFLRVAVDSYCPSYLDEMIEGGA